MTCKNCGSEIKSGAQFCTNCGAPVEQPPAPPIVSEENEKISAPDLSAGIPVEPARAAASAAASAVKNESAKKKIITIVAVVVIAVIAVVALIVALSGPGATNALQNAIDSKDAGLVNSVYAAARGDSSTLEKYDQVIADTIESMQSDLNAHDFDTAALSDAGNAVTDYASSQWGTLMYNPDGETLSASVSSANEPAWEGLTALYDSKTNYCNGLYAYKTSGDYEAAISSFTGVTEADSEFDNTETLIGECADAYIDATLTAVEEKIAEGDLNGGLQLLNAAEAYLDDCGLSSGETAQQLTAKIEETLVSYADTYAQKAEACFNDKDVDGAIGNMEVAMELQPDDADYKTKYDTYQQYLPFYLYDEENYLNVTRTEILTGSIQFDKTTKSNENQEMSHTICWDTRIINDNAYFTTTYNLSGKYDTVKGTMFFPRNRIDESEYIDSYFIVYGDGKKIYESPKMSKDSLAEEISFSVSGIQKLEIEFRGTYGGCVSDLTAQKAFPTE